MRKHIQTLSVMLALGVLLLAGSTQAIGPAVVTSSFVGPAQVQTNPGQDPPAVSQNVEFIRGSASGDAATLGAWGTPFDGGVPAINMVVLHDGRILYWSGLESDNVNGDLDWIFFTAHPEAGESRIVDLSTDPPTVTAPTPIQGAGSDLFCSGQTILPDGRVLTAGGSEWHDLFIPEAFLDGSQHTRIFDPATDSWSRVGDMVNWRWYPSVVTNPEGNAVAASGIFHLTKPDSMVTDVEVYDAQSDDWDVVPGADRLLPMYPRVSYVPGGPLKGDLFYNTVATMWGPFGEHPAEATWSLQQTYNHDTGSWRNLAPSVFGVRQHGASVMLPLSADEGYAPTFVTFGGALYRNPVATQVTEINDLSTDPPTNMPAAPMNYPRWHLNGLLLPDGKVLAVGGGLYDTVYLHGQENVPILPAELFDPTTGVWTELAPMAVPRMYHSTASLLPDGRVLVGGHVPLPNPFPQAREEIPGTGVALNPHTFETRLEIFSPPYMFRGDRPAITEAPTSTGFDSPFTIQVSGVDDLADLDSVRLVRPGATTHSFDSTSRAVDLVVLSNPAPGTFVVQSPPDALAATPGHYMMFVNAADTEGPLPSEASWIHVA